MLLSPMKTYLSFLIAALFFLPSGFAHAAIAFDTSVNGADAAGSVSWSHTVTGANPILFVTTMSHTTTPGDLVTAVTYNGVSMSKAGTTLSYQTGSPIYFNLTLWYLQGPATGTHTVAVTAVGSPETDGISNSYTGAKQTGGIDAYSSQSDAVGSNPAVAITTVANNSWTVLASGAGCVLATAGTGSTLRVSAQPGTFDSNGPITPAGPATMNINYSGACGPFTGSVIASFAPVASALLTPMSIFSLVQSWWLF